MMTVTSTTLKVLENKNLVSVDECINAFHSKNDGRKIVFVDGSMYHKGNRNGRKEFEEGPRITGSKYIDIADIAATKEIYPNLNPKGLPYMLPPKVCCWKLIIKLY